MTQVRASHILLMYRGSQRAPASVTRTKDQARTELERIRDQVRAGGDLAALARRHSDCPSSAEGGDLGTFGRGQMVGAFEQTAFALSVDGDSDLIETPFGFHLIRRTA
jgi:parvulin-like peptidyl-prolyl isomerase